MQYFPLACSRTQTQNFLSSSTKVKCHWEVSVSLEKKKDLIHLSLNTSSSGLIKCTTPLVPGGKLTDAQFWTWPEQASCNAYINQTS